VVFRQLQAERSEPEMKIAAKKQKKRKRKQNSRKRAQRTQKVFPDVVQPFIKDLDFGSDKRLLRWLDTFTTLGFCVEVISSVP
jgi:hypothetical protein